MFSSSDEPVDAPRVQAKDTPSIHGFLVDSAGQPIVGGQVEAGDAGRVKTAEDGSFRFDDLKPGTYKIGATADGFVAGGPPGLRSVEVTLAAGSDAASIRDLRLILQRVGTIRGRVVASGRPVPNATVGIYYQSAQGLADPIEPYVVDAAATSDTNGNFELRDLAPGRLQLLIEAEDYALAESRHLFVEPGENLGPVVIDLAPSATLIGEVVDTQGEAIGAEIVLRSESARPGQQRISRRSQADKTGRFFFRNIPAGVYSLEAISPGFRNTRVEEIEAVVGKTSRHDMVMEPGDGIFGRVLDHTGAPVAGAYVVFNPFGGPAEESHPRAWQRRVRTNQDGQFQWADPPEPNYVATAISPQHADSKPQSVRRGVSNDFELGAPGGIRGRVVGPDGRPVQSFSVGVSNFESEGPIAYNMREVGIERVNDSTGQFHLPRLRPGKYWLSVESPDFAPGTSEMIVTRAGSVASGVVIQLGQAGRVAGTVRDERTGNPIAGAHVAVFEPGSPFSANATRTDQDGRFRIEGVAPGRRSLRVTKKGFVTTVSSGLDVTQNRETTRDITMATQQPGERMRFEGIGAMLSKHEGGVRVQKVFEGHPASQFGLKENDFILGVDGTDVDDLALSHVVERIRGQRGVPVELQVERHGEGRITLEIERGQVIVK
ncbi:carboxypeptidase regulatory-like domain-containing protein [Bradymonas sediminis]|uniref:Uncharacterized protein n=1 Tax=Bradymonas sediminis TaxID=1548548 RepID=A0A2Z4FIA4_9DELT|nr:carboxypeptidase regulatory-like domain-containing protein [Bradymonas sediminis]AWV88771.1 hypothetical protein DN745_05230 [Bradymonas sediminis]TDP61769.1 carboxypeptidase family protein [Bradymonas sediminis]